MQGMIERITKDIKKYGLLAIACIVYIVVSCSILGAVCPLRITTGLPCPGCGMTRAIQCLLKFRFKEAFLMHPFCYILLAVIVYYIVGYYILGRTLKKFKFIIIGIVICALMFYVYRIIRYYPNMEPMVSHYNESILGKIFA